MGKDTYAGYGYVKDLTNPHAVATAATEAAVLVLQQAIRDEVRVKVREVLIICPAAIDRTDTAAKVSALGEHSVLVLADAEPKPEPKPAPEPSGPSVSR